MLPALRFRFGGVTIKADSAAAFGLSVIVSASLSSGNGRALAVDRVGTLGRAISSAASVVDIQYCELGVLYLSATAQQLLEGWKGAIGFLVTRFRMGPLRKRI